MRQACLPVVAGLEMIRLQPGVLILSLTPVLNFCRFRQRLTESTFAFDYLDKKRHDLKCWEAEQKHPQYYKMDKIEDRLHYLRLEAAKFEAAREEAGGRSAYASSTQPNQGSETRKLQAGETEESPL